MNASHRCSTAYTNPLYFMKNVSIAQHWLRCVNLRLWPLNLWRFFDCPRQPHQSIIASTISLGKFIFSYRFIIWSVSMWKPCKCKVLIIPLENPICGCSSSSCLLGSSSTTESNCSNSSSISSLPSAKYQGERDSKSTHRTWNNLWHVLTNSTCRPSGVVICRPLKSSLHSSKYSVPTKKGVEQFGITKKLSGTPTILILLVATYDSPPANE